MGRFLIVLVESFAVLVALMLIPILVGILLIDTLINGWRKQDAVWKLIMIAVVVGIATVAAWTAGAFARDLDGRWANSPNHGWFKQLKNKHGVLCCDGSDGFRVDHADWEVKNGKYRVMLKGAWYEVPDEALITEPNRVGHTMVWPYEMQGQTHIRCFMPGSMA